MKIRSIFESISGEAGPAFPQGTWCTFIRMQGCNLQCKWCDTPDAQGPEGEEMSLADVIEWVHHFDNKNILITGGEPLNQFEDLCKLLVALRRTRKNIQIETNGSIAPPWGLLGCLIADVSWVVDYKCPSSQMHHEMPNPEQFVRIWNSARNYVVKFVIDCRYSDDGLFADRIMKGLRSAGCKEKFLISPIKPSRDVLTFLQSFFVCEVRKGDAYFSVQLHKLINMP